LTSDHEKEKFCGNVSPAEMTFSGCSTLELVFYTDTSVQGNGFKLHFMVYDPLAGWWLLSLWRYFLIKLVTVSVVYLTITLCL